MTTEEVAQQILSLVQEGRQEEALQLLEHIEQKDPEMAREIAAAIMAYFEKGMGGPPQQMGAPQPQMAGQGMMPQMGGMPPKMGGM